MLTAFFDGSCGPKNPGGYCGYGALIYLEGKVIAERSGVCGTPPNTSNNFAEYYAFRTVLDTILSDKLDNLPSTIYGDSKLVIEQMEGRWQMKGGVYMALAKECWRLLDDFRFRPNLRWIPREQNSQADALSKAPIQRYSRG